MLTKTIDGETYFCPRPNYRFRRLDADLLHQGFEEAPTVLFGSERAKVLFDEEGRQWSSNLVTERDLAKRILHDLDWFLATVRRRAAKYEKMKADTRQIVDRLSKLLEQDSAPCEEILQCLERVVVNFSTFVSYVHLPMPDELIVNEFRQILSTVCSVDEANEYLFSLLKAPTYVRNALSRGIHFSEIKITQFPPQDPLAAVGGEVDYNVVSPLDGVILRKLLETSTLENLARVVEFSRYRIVTPIIFQIMEEDFYVGKSVFSCLVHILYHMVRTMVRAGVIQSEDEILDKQLDDIISLYKRSTCA